MEQRLDAREVKLGDYDNQDAVTNGEVAAILGSVLQTRETEGSRIDPMLIRCRDHTVRFNKIMVPQSELGVREYMKAHLVDFEIATLINFAPDSPDAAIELQPSLRRIPLDVLQNILDVLEVAVHADSI